MSEYQYTEEVDAGRLSKEIKASSIAIALKSVVIHASQVKIRFADDLSPAEITVLDGIVAAHEPTPLPEDEAQIVRMKEWDLEDKLLFKTKHVQMPTIPATTEQGDEAATVQVDLTWPWKVSILEADWVNEVEHKGNQVFMVVSPNTVAGAFGDTGLVGDTVITVSPTVTESVKLGYSIKVDCTIGGNDGTLLGKVTAIDHDTNELTLDTPLATQYEVGELIYIEYDVTDEWRSLGSNGITVVGSGRQGGTTIPLGRVVRFKYRYRGDSPAAQALAFFFDIEYAILLES